MKHFFLLAFFFLYLLKGLWGQEYCFSQYYVDKLSISPAFAAIGDYSEIGVVFRDQWPGIEGGYKIYNVEYQQKLPSFDSGLGVRFFGDVSGGGAYSLNHLSFGYAYRFSLSDRVKCALGLQTSLFLQTLKQADMVYYSMIESATGRISPLNDVVENNKNLSLNFASGGVFYTKRTLLALGLHNFSSISLVGEKNLKPMTITALVNHKLKIASYTSKNKVEEVFLVPGICFSHNSVSDMVMPGVYFSSKTLLGTLAFRYQYSNFSSSSFVTGFGFKFKDFELLFGYDFYFGVLSTRTFNSMEVGLKYKFENSEKNNGSKTILCPAF